MQSGSFRSSVFNGFYVSFTQVEIQRQWHSDSSNKKKKDGRTTSNLLPKSNPRVGSKAKKTSATECLIITRPSYRKRADITLLLFWVTLYQWHKSDPTPSLSRRHSAISPTVLSQACDISRVKYGQGNSGLGTLFKKIRSSEKHLCALYFLSTHRGPDKYTKYTAIRRNDAHSERQAEILAFS